MPTWHTSRNGLKQSRMTFTQKSGAPIKSLLTTWMSSITRALTLKANSLPALSMGAPKCSLHLSAGKTLLKTCSAKTWQQVATVIDVDSLKAWPSTGIAMKHWPEKLDLSRMWSLIQTWSRLTTLMLSMTERIAMDSPNALQLGITVARQPRKREMETTRARMVGEPMEMAVILAKTLAMEPHRTPGSSQVISSLMSKSDR